MQLYIFLNKIWLISIVFRYYLVRDVGISTNKRIDFPASVHPGATTPCQSQGYAINIIFSSAPTLCSSSTIVFLCFASQVRNQIRPTYKVTWLWIFEIQLIFSSIIHNSTLIIVIIERNVLYFEKEFNDYFDGSRMSDLQQLNVARNTTSPPNVVFYCALQFVDNQISHNAKLWTRLHVSLYNGWISMEHVLTETSLIIVYRMRFNKSLI